MFFEMLAIERRKPVWCRGTGLLSLWSEQAGSADELAGLTKTATNCGGLEWGEERRETAPRERSWHWTAECVHHFGCRRGELPNRHSCLVGACCASRTELEPQNGSSTLAPGNVCRISVCSNVTMLVNFTADQSLLQQLLHLLLLLCIMLHARLLRRYSIAPSFSQNCRQSASLAQDHLATYWHAPAIAFPMLLAINSFYMTS